MNCLASNGMQCTLDTYVPNILKTIPATPVIELQSKMPRISAAAGIILAHYTYGNIETIQSPLTQIKTSIEHLQNITEINNDDLANNTAIAVIKDGLASYNILTNTKTISDNIFVGGKSMEELMKKNIAKIKEFANLDLNWNGYGAEPFTHELLGNADKIIKNIIVQPKVFPTGRQSIQFEYEKDSGEYLELEVFDDHIEVFNIDKNGLENEYDIEIDENEVNKVVAAFNG